MGSPQDTRHQRDLPLISAHLLSSNLRRLPSTVHAPPHPSNSTFWCLGSCSSLSPSRVNSSPLLPAVGTQAAMGGKEESEMRGLATSAERAWGEPDVLHPLLVRAVQCTESLMTQLQQARDQAAIAGPGRPFGLISSAILPSRHIGPHLEPRCAALGATASYSPAWLVQLRSGRCAVCCRREAPPPPRAA